MRVVGWCLGTRVEVELLDDSNVLRMRDTKSGEQLASQRVDAVESLRLNGNTLSWGPHRIGLDSGQQDAAEALVESVAARAASAGGRRPGRASGARSARLVDLRSERRRKRTNRFIALGLLVVAGTLVVLLKPNSGDNTKEPAALLAPSGKAECRDPIGDEYYGYTSGDGSIRDAGLPGGIDLSDVRLEATGGILTLDVRYENGAGAVQHDPGEPTGQFLLVVTMGIDNDHTYRVVVEGGDGSLPNAEVSQFDLTDGHIVTSTLMVVPLSVSEETIEMEIPSTPK